jgi:anion-transporting  ArsA/GET3 family ATPase
MDMKNLANITESIEDHLVFYHSFLEDTYKSNLEQIIMEIDNYKDIINQLKMNELSKRLIDINNAYMNSKNTIKNLYELKDCINEYHDTLHKYNYDQSTILITLQEDSNYSENRSKNNLLDYIICKNNVIHKKNKVLEAIENIPEIKKEYYS